MKKYEDFPTGLVMVVDDNPANVDLLKKLLKRQGYNVQTFINSRFALKSALSSPPNLILLDIKMPDIDGFAFSRLLKENPETADVPVIFISALVETEDKLKAFEAGGVDYITKPFQAAEVLARVRTHLDLYITKKHLDELVDIRTAELQDSELKLLKAQQIAHIGSWELDLITDSLYWSDEIYRIFGLQPQQFGATYEAFLKYIHPDDREFVNKAYTDSVKNKTSYNIVHRLLLDDGTIKYVNERYDTTYNDKGKVVYSIGTVQDITTRIKYEEQIKASLDEKEALLRELYHRTKNNMQVISALLGMRASSENSERVSDVFQEMENKIQSMSLVHDKLYEFQNLSSINLKAYITDLSKLMKDSYLLSDNCISFIMNLEDVSVLIDTAMPLGLVLNELILNAFKHAFPDNRDGEICISLHKLEDGTIELVVSDNGIGVAEDYDFINAPTLGIQTIFLLGESQLQGKIIFDGSSGVKCTMVFKDNIYEPRV